MTSAIPFRPGLLFSNSGNPYIRRDTLSSDDHTHGMVLISFFHLFQRAPIRSMILTQFINPIIWIIQCSVRNNSLALLQFSVIAWTWPPCVDPAHYVIRFTLCCPICTLALFGHRQINLYHGLSILSPSAHLLLPLSQLKNPRLNIGERTDMRINLVFTYSNNIYSICKKAASFKIQVVCT